MWYGVDLDGTLAVAIPYEKLIEDPDWQDIVRIGPPTPLVDKVRHMIEAGCEVRIFTARANDPKQHEPIRDWLEANGLPRTLQITATKDYELLEMWDDRAKRVEFNTGRIMDVH